MKKLLTLLLTAALATAAATTAFATDNTIKPGDDGNTDPKTGTTNVTYTVQPTYTVTIPGTVTLDSTTKKSEATVKAENVTVPYNYAVKVTLTDANGFQVKSEEGAKLTYKVTESAREKTEGSVVLQVASDRGEGNLEFEITDKVTYSGKYTGTVTFTVSVDQVK